jgi:glutamyl-tRNA reductase
MAVKMLTTKKHSKMAKLIQKSKEPIEVVKANPKNMVDKPIGKTFASIKKPKIIGARKQSILVAINKPIANKMVKKPIAKIPKIGKREYNRALKIVNQYLTQNEKN